MYLFVGKKPRAETRESTHMITMASHNPRQIVDFDVAFDKSPHRIQRIVDSALDAKHYCTDGWSGYLNVAYPGQHLKQKRYFYS